MSKFKLFSFFSGAGFLDLGFEHAGFEVVYVNEYHQPFLEAYKYSRKKLGMTEPEFGYSDENIEVLLDTLPGSDLELATQKIRKRGEKFGFIGGPPCPDFSIGGKNAGRLGNNGKLSQIYIELICRLAPDFFIFENVKGLWRTKRHREYFDEIRDQVKRRGYLTDAKLLNSISFGAPQDRDRIILLGVHDNYNENAFSDDLPFDWKEGQKYPCRSAFNYTWPETTAFRENEEVAAPNQVPLDLTVQYWFSKNSVDEHPNSRDFFTPRAGLPKFLTIPEGDVSKKSSKRLHRWRYSPTVAYGNNEVHLHPYKARRLSAAEALALQSLPKEFELPDDMTLSNKFKTIGNGVPYEMAKGLGHSLLKYLEN